METRATLNGGIPALSATAKKASDLDGAGDRWLKPEILDEARDWLERRLCAGGRTVDSVTRAQVRPWGLVLRIDASGETFWFKANAEGGAHEPALMQWLHDQVPGQVPATVAVDSAHRWWLAADAGRTLADHDGGAPVPLAAWKEVLTGYAALQRRLENTVREAPPGSLTLFGPAEAPQAFAALLDDSRRLLVGDERGLTREEHAALVAALPAFTRWCEELAAAGIPLTVQHDDLSDANVCHGANGYTVIDWADAHLAHPFGSLLFPLRSFRDQHALPLGHPDVEALADAYLACWADRLDLPALRRLMDLALRVAVVGKALSWSRALHGLDRTTLNAYYASPESRWLRKLLTGTPPY
ncbi:aminoglycoside phosphotransferase family protein [Streptomyces massasporeus]|uniref:hypothetical protein n=1 Tax=Streptomyces massasporeus TaxID=67324 RepID=UPI003657C660